MNFFIISRSTQTNVKLEYQKLFNSIKKTRYQTQKELDKLIAHVSEKTYAYGVIRAENQNLLFTILELETRLANVEKGDSLGIDVGIEGVAFEVLSEGIKEDGKYFCSAESSF
ncbi:hypothetical protein Tco_0763575 [Tanacetum coccineum]